MTAPGKVPPATPVSQIEDVVTRVKSASTAFARTSINERIALLEAMIAGYQKIGEASVKAACLAKGIDEKSALAGEEYFGGPLVTLRIMRLTAQALREVNQYGAPRFARKAFRRLDDGRWVVRVFPQNVFDSVLLPRHQGEVYLNASVNPDNVQEFQALGYRKPHDGKLCVVLGAGNINSIAPTDVVYKMFVEGTACILKMNPVNGYLGPFIEEAFASVIARGFFAVVHGGAEQGAFLSNHSAVDEIHITGSDQTHDLMVWGKGPDAEHRRKKNQPLLTKEISSELGCITPVIVVPGPFSQAELAYQGRSIAGMVSHNASFNCNAAKLLVTSRGWGQRGALLDRIEAGLKTAPVRKAYYPGAEQRWHSLVDGRPHVRLIGKAQAGELPWAMVTDLDAENESERAITQEPWCSLVSEVSFDTIDVAEFLDRTVHFVNQKVWGTLCAMMVVHPKLMEEVASRRAIEKALLDLNYGAVAVNSWAGAAFALGQAPWGAHPGATLQNIQSGRGFVHNTFMLAHHAIEKFVLRAPLNGRIVFPWFPGHRTADRLAKKLIDLQVSPHWTRVPEVAALGLSA